jgi:hypothetical protein
MRRYGKQHPELFASHQTASTMTENTNEVMEASGYIPTAAEANDPRYKMALTVDVRPGAIGKAANAFMLNTDSQGHPQLANPDGTVKRLAEEFARFKL